MRSKPETSKVPVGWMVNNKLFWPPRNLSVLMNDPTSEADPATWKVITNFKVIGKPMTNHDAEKHMLDLSQVTDSDDTVLMERGTRQTKAKEKDKFASNLYKLQPPLEQPVSEHFL